MLNSI